MVKILFFGDLVETLGMASDEIKLPPDVTDVERLLFVLSKRGEMWKKMLLGNPKLNVTVEQAVRRKIHPGERWRRDRAGRILRGLSHVQEGRG